MIDSFYLKIGDTLIEAPKPTRKEISRAREELLKFLDKKEVSELTLEIYSDLKLSKKKNVFLKRQGDKLILNGINSISPESVIVALAAGRRYHKL